MPHFVEVLWKFERYLNEILPQTLPCFISVNSSEKNPPCCFASNPERAWFNELREFSFMVLSSCSNVTDNCDFILFLYE